MTRPVHDHVIVGAGSAGCVLAARLTEDREISVLVLEAGPDYRAADAPAAVTSISPMTLLTSSDTGAYRWDDLDSARTAAQEPINLLRGRGTGGSSAVNGMLAVRPEADDLDAWAAAGCHGWGWDEMLPWFNAIERDTDFGDRPYHGDSGPFPVWRPPVDGWGDIEVAVKDALLDLGYPWCEDHNAPGSAGVGPYAANVENGRRVSASTAYLEAARDRPNLTVWGDCTVDRVVVTDGVAEGVLFRRDGEEQFVECRSVILAAGSPFSPAIMLRSGIGPAEDLASTGIDVVRDLPGVGLRVGDHPSFNIMISSEPGAMATASNGRHINCFARYTSGLAGGGVNDMAMLSGANPELTPSGKNRSTIVVALWQPFSSGELRLTSTDPHAMPAIDELMLSDPRDLVRLRDGFRRLCDVLQHPLVAALPGRRRYGATGIPVDDVEELVALDDDAVDELLVAHAYDTQHIVGGCAMGDPSTDTTAVVDPRCRVPGIDGLRVIDGSVFPTCPRANTHFTVLALAERMADRLRNSD